MRTRLLLTLMLVGAMLFPLGGPAAAQDPPNPAPTFATTRVAVDALVTAGGITPSLEAKIRHALDMAEDWMAMPKKRGPALSHLERAIGLLEWQADVVDRTGKPQGDPVGLRALAAEVNRLANAYRDPGGASKNFNFIRTLGGMSGMTSINVMNYDDRDVLVAVGRFGVKTFDLTNPQSPEALDHLTSNELRLPTDPAPSSSGSNTFWQSESTNVDQDRKLIFLSRDPRAYLGNQDNPAHRSGVYIVDASNPENLTLNLFHDIPAGHTSTCINDCQFLWTGGPARRADMPAAWGGRPIYVTDIRNPAAPYTYPDPIDMGRNQGITDYAHDVQVDNDGIAWVSGRGSVRGYHTLGFHHDPLLGESRMASAWDPIPYAGGGGPQVWSATGPAVMHNSERPTGTDPGTGVPQRDSERPHRPYASDGSDYTRYGFEPGELLYATHEDFNGSCEQRGRFYIASLRGSYNGESWRATQENPFRLDIVSSWHPYEQEGYLAGTANCSGHYFRMLDGLVYMSWYGQGTRVLDIRDPYNPTQVAYFRPTGTNSYTTMPYKGFIYAADSARGLDILSLDDRVLRQTGRAEAVVAPPFSAEELAASTSANYRPDPVMGWLCPLPL